jgi:NADPH:quinone reductase-like Zn-dependent oxidoreductase
MIFAEAWVLYPGDPNRPGPGRLEQELVHFPDIEGDEVLVEPLYGSWEGNMTHALLRKPVDIVRQRGEPKIVLGNSGIVRVIKCRDQTGLKEGDICGVASIGSADPFGYVVKAWGYDKVQSMGLLCKKCKIPASQLLPLPKSRFSLQQWAGFWIRYPTAWSNWKIAYKAWRLQMTEEQAPATHVWGWGGGVSFAELTLARHFGCKPVMICSGRNRAALLERNGIIAVDRTELEGIQFDDAEFASSAAYRRTYLRAEARFMRRVRDITEGSGVSIFIENIGVPVYRSTLRALSRQGVIATSGWKHGGVVTMNRAVECIERRIHVHTHGARWDEVVDSVNFAEQHGWMPPAPARCYKWDEIPLLASEYERGALDDYFPIYEVNDPGLEEPAVRSKDMASARGFERFKNRSFENRSIESVK